MTRTLVERTHFKQFQLWCQPVRKFSISLAVASLGAYDSTSTTTGFRPLPQPSPVDPELFFLEAAIQYF
jgi:hypothetical protein